MKLVTLFHTVDLGATFQKEAVTTAFRFDARQGIIRAARTEESWAKLNEVRSENPFQVCDLRKNMGVVRL